MIIITIGVVLIVSGLYLMVRDVLASTQVAQTNLAKSAVSAIDWIPGIPFYIGDLAKSSVTVVGLVSWILGIDLLLVGLGVWVRQRIARFAALVIFGFAGFFEFLVELGLSLGRECRLDKIEIEKRLQYVEVPFRFSGSYIENCAGSCAFHRMGSDVADVPHCM